MYKHNTFSEILKLLDKRAVAKTIENHKSDKHSKGFNTWNQLVVMLFSQLSSCRSLRDLEIRFNIKSHYHLKVTAIKRSTLSDANKKRSSDVFKDIATQLISDQNHELKEVVSLLDSTTIRVDGRGSEWTDNTKTKRSKGLKLHIQCGAGTKTIEAATITNTNVNDITEAREFNLEAGKIYVFDKAYLDFNWWNKIALVGGHFVTRIKKNTAYKVIEECNIEESARGIVSDKVIELTNKNPRSGKVNLLAGKPLRLVEATDDKKAYHFISNLLDATANEIAGYYKQRWGIELLFKWLKQNLKITSFLSENENAIKIQIYIAIIAYVLISMFKKLFSGVFTRTIDLLSWIKGTIFFSYIPPEPPSLRKCRKIYSGH